MDEGSETLHTPYGLRQRASELRDQAQDAFHSARGDLPRARVMRVPGSLRR